MGHCISVLLCKQEDVRSDTEYSVNLNAGIAAIESKNSESISDLSKGRMVAFIDTDYFGGYGNQAAEVWFDGKEILNLNDFFDIKLKPINSALSLLGVKPEEGKDNFDTVGLGNFRTNSDFVFKRKINENENDAV